jgi:GT2 family glycosyltransferase
VAAPQERRSWPAVTIVFLVFNRRDELRESLQRMLGESDYPSDRVDVVVVDNGSSDGSGQMVRDEFPAVRLIELEENVGVSGWNAGFAVAEGEFVLVLDDDCYLPADGLRRAVTAAEEHSADFVSFGVASTADPEHLFTDESPMGLMSFWGCACLVRGNALRALGGFDPEIFIWDHELEFMVRFFDRGYRHLHEPGIVAQHMKPPLGGGFDERWYRANAHHFAYVAAKHMRGRDAAGAVIAILATRVRDGLRKDRASFSAVPDVLRGAVHGLRLRSPVSNPEVSRTYRRNFHGFASPWWLSRSPGDVLRGRNGGRNDQYFEQRTRFYPDGASILEF